MKGKEIKYKWVKKVRTFKEKKDNRKINVHSLLFTTQIR